MFFWQTSNCFAGLLLEPSQLVAVFGRHFAQDLPAAGVFDASGRLGRRLAQHLADLQAAVGPHDHLHPPAAFPAGGGRKHPQQPHCTVPNHVVSHDRMSPIAIYSVSETAGQRKERVLARRDVAGTRRVPLVGELSPEACILQCRSDGTRRAPAVDWRHHTSRGNAAAAPSRKRPITSSRSLLRPLLPT